MERTPFDIVMNDALQEESGQGLSMKEIEDDILSIVSKACAIPLEIVQRDYSRMGYQTATFREKGLEMPYTIRDLLKMDINELIMIGVTRDVVNVWILRCMCTIAGFRFDFAYQGPYAVSGIGEKIEQCLYELRGNKTLSNIDPYEATVEELCALRDRFAA